ncbi:uncharacterized protein F5891DRAFT_1187234 [Suillus fuscotomentosus]|uniref:Heterokaryon incompatibility domain-containing protein n=1 Tax=Suillus fuscotomentosus TaxID=1912939 RepID=A0AAD4HMD6_9AGAM|nr:uncharacterized protein F5891DRAFT_1187234 [Suillus fuscotomentosus]KAG1901767.1 hypothetical protein F5891DRAFT_1187234 [Suillus fuscotomentosus]
MCAGGGQQGAQEGNDEEGNKVLRRATRCREEDSEVPRGGQRGAEEGNKVPRGGQQGAQEEDRGEERRAASPTTGICRKFIVQAVTPSGKFEVPLKDNANHISKLAIWLVTHSPFKGWIIFEWIRKSVWFALKLLWPTILFLYTGSGDFEDDTDSSYNTGYYKPYLRQFQGQLWAARSRMEHSSRIKEEADMITRTHACYPRILMICNPNKNEWVRCVDRNIIIHTKYIAISYCASDVYSRGLSEKKEKAQFTDDIRVAVLDQQFNAYWLDLECPGETPSEENLDVYCMSDVYCRAEMMLIMLRRADSREKECWMSWGGRVWTFSEALLSSRLCYKFWDREEVEPLSLFQLANLAYMNSEDEQAIINAHAGGKDPLERLEHLMLLKKAIWRRAMANFPTLSDPPLLPKSYMVGRGSVTGEGHKPHKAEHVYALMGFFEHRIQPNHDEDQLCALTRLSMANDSDHMVSMFPSTTTAGACWYADNDIYDANLWDILPEIHVTGVTENRALVLDGCRVAAIRWKDFPEVPFSTTFSLRRKIVSYIPYFSWSFIIIGLCLIPVKTSKALAEGFILIGIRLLLFLSPQMFLYSKSGPIVTKQP